MLGHRLSPAACRVCLVCLALAGALLASTGRAAAGPKRKPYRLKTLSVKQPLLWGAECRRDDGGGLAFGGQDQTSPDGRPHTRVLVDGRWQAIDKEMRTANPLQGFHDQTWRLRGRVKDLRAVARRIYFLGLTPKEEAKHIASRVEPARGEIAAALTALMEDLRSARKAGEYEAGQVRVALGLLAAARGALAPVAARITPADIKTVRAAQGRTALAAEALDAEPPARALSPIVYEPTSKRYVLFGGDHQDYLTNDTWVFDPARRRWRQRHPASAPPPRANHNLTVKDGKVTLSGGYTYVSNTDYCGGQYVDHDDGECVYDVTADVWRGKGLVGTPARVYRTGPFHPDFYMQGDRPDAAAVEATLKHIPANTWVPANPPYRPRLNRDWGTVVLDPKRDMLLRWSGGHSAHGGTDVPHYHLSTNRWELAYPVEFPLGQLYSNTSYPGGYNLNRRPGMTGHTYQNYGFDPVSGMMVQTGHYEYYYIYDPDRADWVGRGPKPAGMKYNSCFYTLTLCATPEGLLCWTKGGQVYLYSSARGWTSVKLTKAKLPGAMVDNSTLVYDSRRNRILLFVKPYGKRPYDGQVHELDMGSLRVRALSPAHADAANRIAWIDRACYTPIGDLVLLATYLGAGKAWTPTPAYDCAKNRWTTLDLKYSVKSTGYRTRRAMPHGHSAGVVFDPKRKLLWGTDTDSQVYLLRLDPAGAVARPLAGQASE